MVDQLNHLIELAGRPNIRIHVLTYDQGSRCHLDGVFTLLELPNRKHMVFVQALGAGLLISEQDAVDTYIGRVRSILGEALSWPDSITYIERLKRELYEQEPPVVEEQP